MARKQTDQIVGTLLDDLLAGIRTPERPRSPVDANVTDEELFRRRNPHVCCYVVIYYNISCTVFLFCAVFLIFLCFCL